MQDGAFLWQVDHSQPADIGTLMASGRSTQLTKQIGEHLVAAELGRLGYMAAPFAGNVPMFDLLAANLFGTAVPIQVKAIKGSSWQFRADDFLKIKLQKNGRQVVQGPLKLPVPSLLCILVQLGEKNGEDRFYILRLRDLQRHFLATYKSRIRPRNPNSLHCAVWPKHL
jgi:hypothetical protein